MNNIKRKIKNLFQLFFSHIFHFFFFLPTRIYSKLAQQENYVKIKRNFFIVLHFLWHNNNDELIFCIFFI